MNREQLRIWIHEQVPVGEEVFGAIWSWLERNRWLAEYDQRIIRKEDLLEQAHKLVEFLDQVRPPVGVTIGYSPPIRPGRKAPDEVSLELDDYTRKRAHAASEVAATFADKHPDVKKFRNTYLGGEDVRLSEEEAQEFLENPPSGEILDELLSLAKRLGWRYRWTYRDVWWFLLTGPVPYIVPLRVHYTYIRDEPDSPEPLYPNMAEITLIVEPWVDAKNVERVYRDVQRQMRGGRNRKQDEHTLDVVRFAARQFLENGNVSWLEITRRWNKAQPNRSYKSYRGLYQVFKRFVRRTYNEPKFLDSRQL